MKNILFNPKYIGLLAIFFLKLAFTDVLFISQGNSFNEMSLIGNIGIIGFYISIGWLAIFMFIIPIFYKIFSKNK